MDLSFYPLRFEFRALDPVRFPPGLASNVLRGGLGLMLRAHAPREIYERIFEPSASEKGPSGLKNHPRPFVLRARHLDGERYERGDSFYFDVHLFDMLDESRLAIRTAFEALGQAGFGVGRGRAELLDLETPAPITLQLIPTGPPISQLRIELLTPLELKSAGEVSQTLEFPVLFARIRDRISTLRSLYGPGPLEIPFKEMAKRADGIRIAACELKECNRARRSSRTGQVHDIGGLTGSVVYAGDLREFLPYLQAAEFCGVGRHCVWGKGQIRVTECK